MVSLGLVELLLRHWARQSLSDTGARATIGSQHALEPGQWKLKEPELLRADAEFSITQFREAQEWLATRGKHWREHYRPSTDSPVVLNRLSDQDFLGTQFSIRNRERTTTNRPAAIVNEIFCFGGSTTFCIEVADSKTWCSLLQKRVNDETQSSRFRVRNLGIGGTPGLERIYTLREATPIRHGDIAVFLFGDNDSGWKMYGCRQGLAHDNLPAALRWFLRHVAARSELAGWLYREISPRYLRRLAVEMAETTIAAAEDAAKFAQSRGANVLFVLQPNIFTLARRDSRDRRIIAATARDLPIMLAAAYQRFREWIADSSIAVDATHIFDSESPSPYMEDWAHANARGNRLIGEFVFDQLKALGLLDPVTSLK